MKVGIVTLHNAFNYGAYLQAYGTQKKLTELGHLPTILRLETVASRRARYRTLISRRLSTCAFNIRKYAAFRRAWDRLPLAPGGYSRERDEYDAMVLGSDEIWNVRNPTFAAVPAYFGVGLRAKTLVTYAPSVSESSLADLQRRPETIEGMRGIHFLSARDERTREVIVEATGRVPTMVLDPTFLVDFERETVPSGRRRFLLVYTYEFDRGRIETVTTFARRHGLKLLSAGFDNTWCDEVVAATPFEFLGLVQAADYVVTDTFHGTIFSILFGKSFGSFAARKMKVGYLLRSLGLADRDLDIDGPIDDVLLRPIDRDVVQRAIAPLRRQSTAFLESSLSGHT